MPLRRPRYLNRSDFYDYADYAEIEVPRRTEVTERTARSRDAGGSVGLPDLVAPLKGEGHLASHVEMQRAYTLETGEKTMFSNVLASMVEAGPPLLTSLPVQQRRGTSWPEVHRDDLVQISGDVKLSPVSSAGKVFHVMLQILRSDDLDLDDLLDVAAGFDDIEGEDPDDTDDTDDDQHDHPESDDDDDGSLPAQAKDVFRRVYLANEVPDIPILFRLTPDDTNAPWDVYISCTPGHFIGQDAATTEALTGQLTVLGVVRQVVSGDPNDGYETTEPWLLHGWEHTLRTKMRLELDTITTQLIPAIDSEWKPEDASYYIQGPALILDAVAIY